MIKLIIWDYNGTVIDDLDTTIAAVNDMLKRRNLQPTDKYIYRETLTMPLDKYYSTVGINNVDISVLSVEFRNSCIENEHLSKIFDDFEDAITKAKNLNISNILLSSLFHGYLTEETDKYGITEHFDYICGMKDTAVGSKTENAKRYILSQNFSPEEVLFIGDLLSDAETAKELGAKCILVSRGHCSHFRCLTAGVPVFKNLEKALEYALSNY